MLPTLAGICNTSLFVISVNFQAHKPLLSISSPVFEGMFYGPMADKNLKDVKLDDVKPSGFRTVPLLLNPRSLLRIQPFYKMEGFAV